MIEKKATIVDAIADYGDRLMGLLVSLSGNMHDAKDIYQETWLKVFMSPRFDAEQIKKGTLVFVSAKRLFIDQYRKNKSETQKRGALAELVFNPKSLQSPVSQDASTRSQEIELKKRFWAGYPDLDLAEEKKQVHRLHARYGFTFLGNRRNHWRVKFDRMRLGESIQESSQRGYQSRKRKIEKL